MSDTKTLCATTIDLLAKLVAFDSVSRNSNLPVIQFIDSYLKELGVTTQLVPSPDGKKANLLARVGPEIGGGIVLSGHTDVVPIDGQQWDSDPFVLMKKDGKLYGRGTSDMKAFIACCLALTPEWAKLKLQKPIYFAFSYDEEIGCLGAPFLLKHIQAHMLKPAFAIIGEPTLMQVVTAHKGVFSYETTVHGLEWHSSQPHYGANAVQAACALVNFLSLLADEIAAKGARDERFDPPYSTVHVGVIQGGTARNIIPKECHFNWEIRPLPGDDGDAIYAQFEKRSGEILAAMRKNFPKAEIVTRPNSRMLGVTLPAEASNARAMVMRSAETNQEYAVSFGTEAGVFNDHGVPAIVCGPGNIEQAHKPNEFIEESQITACITFLLKLESELTHV